MPIGLHYSFSTLYKLWMISLINSLPLIAKNNISLTVLTMALGHLQLASIKFCKFPKVPIFDLAEASAGKMVLNTVPALTLPVKKLHQSHLFIHSPLRSGNAFSQVVGIMLFELSLVTV